MRFEVKYPGGSQHEIELSGTVAVLGRDPSCDLVLNDAKCSRRHAVIEAGPQGVAIRDAGSANGIYVNGKKVERANLVDGDVVRLGEVTLKVLPEVVAGTIVMAPEELAAQANVATDRTASVPPMESPFMGGIPPAPAAPAAPPAPAALPVVGAGLPRAAPALRTAPSAAVQPPVRLPPAPAAAPAAKVAAPPPAFVSRPAPPPQPPAPSPWAGGSRPSAMAAPAGRPLTITALAVLWMLGILFYPVAGIGFAARNGWSGAGAWAALALGVAAFFVSALMAYGLWTRAPWARPMQIALAGLGLLSCAFLPAGAVILAYMLRDDTRAHFTGRRVAAANEGPNESLFTMGIVGAALIPFLLAALLAIVDIAAPSFLKSAGGRPVKGGTVNLGRMRAVAAAEQAFSSGTCGSFADLEGLLKPASVIPNYPPAGPAFLAADLALPESSGYRYALQVGDPVPPSEGCPSRSFRRFFYSATPVAGVGRHYLIGSDGVVRAADDRPASPSDPPLLQ